MSYYKWRTIIFRHLCTFCKRSTVTAINVISRSLGYKGLSGGGGLSRATLIAVWPSVGQTLRSLLLSRVWGSWLVPDLLTWSRCGVPPGFTLPQGCLVHTRRAILAGVRETIGSEHASYQRSRYSSPVGWIHQRNRPSGGAFFLR